MNLSIVVEDGTVVQDGEAFTKLDVSSVPINIRALQWRGDAGHIEYVNGDTETRITELPAWALTVQSHLLDAKANDNKESPELVAKLVLQEERKVIEAAYPAVAPSSLLQITNSGLPSISMTPYIRKADGAVIGAYSGTMLGAEGVNSFHTLTQLQRKVGCPIFANPATSPENLDAFLEMLRVEGYTVHGSSTDLFSYPLWTLDMAKAAAKISRAAEVFSTAESAGFTWQGMLFDADATARANVAAKAVQLVLDPSITMVGWKLKTNMLVAIPAADFKQMALDLTLHMEGVYQNTWAIKAQIDAATTIAEVEAL